MRKYLKPGVLIFLATCSSQACLAGDLLIIRSGKPQGTPPQTQQQSAQQQAVPVELLEAIVKAATQGAVTATLSPSATAPAAPTPTAPSTASAAADAQRVLSAPTQPEPVAQQAAEQVPQPQPSAPSWTVKKGLKDTLTEWAKQAEIDLVWPSLAPDHIFSARLQVSGSDIYSAVESLFQASGLAAYSVKAFGNAIVVEYQ